jgi:hypothetical protein
MYSGLRPPLCSSLGRGSQAGARASSCYWHGAELLVVLSVVWIEGDEPIQQAGGCKHGAVRWSHQEPVMHLTKESFKENGGSWGITVTGILLKGHSRITRTNNSAISRNKERQYKLSSRKHTCKGIQKKNGGSDACATCSTVVHHILK